MKTLKFNIRQKILNQMLKTRFSVSYDVDLIIRLRFRNNLNMMNMINEGYKHYKLSEISP